MEEKKKQLGGGLGHHVLLVCFPGQGHVNPSLRLANAIASEGLLVTFSSNQATGNLINKASGNPTGDLLPVGNGHLRFEFFDDGADLAADGLDVLMHKLETAGPAVLEALIRRQGDVGRPVAYVVNNPFLPWVVTSPWGWASSGRSCGCNPPPSSPPTTTTPASQSSSRRPTRGGTASS